MSRFFGCCGDILTAGKVSKSAVGFGHLVSVFFFLNSRALVVVGFAELGRNAVSHADTLAGAGSLHKPHSSKVLLALTLNFKRDLIVSTTNTTRTSLHVWFNVTECGFEDLKWVFDLQLVGSLL